MKQDECPNYENINNILVFDIAKKNLFEIWLKDTSLCNFVILFNKQWTIIRSILLDN